MLWMLSFSTSLPMTAPARRRARIAATEMAPSSGPSRNTGTDSPGATPAAAPSAALPETAASSSSVSVLLAARAGRRWLAEGSLQDRRSDDGSRRKAVAPENEPDLTRPGATSADCALPGDDSGLLVLSGDSRGGGRCSGESGSGYTPSEPESQRRDCCRGSRKAGSYKCFALRATLMLYAKLR